MVTYPKDWTEKTFEQFIKIKRGASPRPIEAYLTKSHNGVNWIKIGDASKGSKYITATKEKITEQGAVHSVSVFPGDFILSNSMSFGRPYILKIDGCIHDGWLRLFDFSEDADGEFLYYLLSSNYVQNQYSAFAAGSGVQNLNKEVVKKVSIYLPPMTEQKRIVETLSSFDEYDAFKDHLFNGDRQEEEMELIRMLGDPTTTLCQCLWFLMEKRKWLYPETFNEKTLLHKNYHGKIKNNKYNNMKTNVLMPICVGLKLVLRLTEKVFDKSDNKLNYYNDPDKSYIRIMEFMPGLSIQDFNTILEKQGLAPLGTVSKDEK